MGNYQKKDSTPNNVGRPLKDIDWKNVEWCLEAGLSGVQTAAYIGVHAHTLYAAVEREFGCTFTDFSNEKCAKGESKLALTQFKEALKGDRGMLIWLGKQRLKQRDYKDFSFGEKGIPPVTVINYADIESEQGKSSESLAKTQD